MGLEDKIRDLIKQLEEEKRLGDKRAEQFYNLTKYEARVHAYMSANMLNLTDNTWTQCVLDSEVYDGGSDFAVGTYLFTAPVTGYYYIFGTVGFHNVVGDSVYDVKLDKNSGTIIASGNSANGNTTSQVSGQCGGVFYLAAGDTVGLWARARCGANTVDILGNNPAYTNMFVHLLSK